MTSLITRLREAKEGGMELDALIHAALFDAEKERSYWQWQASRSKGTAHKPVNAYWLRHATPVTTDLSAAVALKDRALGKDWRGGSICWTPAVGENAAWCCAELVPPWPDYPRSEPPDNVITSVERGPNESDAACMARALCLAILTAKERDEAARSLPKAEGEIGSTPPKSE